MSTYPIVAPKKLIEVALPLDDINKASAREKSIRHGHPSTLHLWWARRPLAAARAVLFAQLVNDPSWKYSEEELKKPGVKGAVTKKRNELFQLLKELVPWENTNNQEVLERARKEIRASWRETCEANKNHPDAKTLFDPEKLPAFHDPFAGGGSIPLEAQRLGLESHASDLNPVAVLINKAMIEIPPKFAGRPPVGPISKSEKQTKAKATEDWSGAKGLAEDVRRYGAWMREEAEKRIGHLYPKVAITKAMAKDRPDLLPYVGKELTVIAWLWARTVKSPHPAYSHVDVPLASSFVLSQKEGRQAWVEPVVKGDSYALHVRVGNAPKVAAAGTKVSRSFRCLIPETAITYEYVDNEANAGRMGRRLLGVVAEGDAHRLYLSPDIESARVAASANPTWRPETPARGTFASNAQGRIYGFKTFADYFTPRQLVALTTFSDLVQEAAARCECDAIAAGVASTGKRLDEGGTDAKAYSEAIATLLSFVLSKVADGGSSLCRWMAQRDSLFNTYSKQALPMVWDFAEINSMADCTRSLSESVKWTAESIEGFTTTPVAGRADICDASSADVSKRVLSSDPPYYDNIGYADLSDFFYVWLRRALKPIYPSLFAGLAVPKAEELIASPYRHGGKEKAESFFLDGMTRAIHNLATNSNAAFPATIYYAFKQSDTSDASGTASTGWDTFLQAVIEAGYSITGTWPIRTERDSRSVGIGTNALASSIVLVCRARPEDSLTISRKDFLRQLGRALGPALAEMTADPTASIAPVDLAQAAIGPGMAIFSKYSAVLEADGSPMPVRQALVHINKAIDDYFAEAEGDLDADTRFSIGWFQHYGFEPGAFGEADVLARAKGTSVDGVKEAGVLHAEKGKVRLLKVKEYPKKWDPREDSRVPVWEACHQMCRALGESEHAAGELLARMPEKEDAIRQLAYRLYTLCERQGRAEEARSYNELVTSWPAIVEESHKVGHVGQQRALFGNEG